MGIGVTGSQKSVNFPHLILLQLIPQRHKTMETTPTGTGLSVKLHVYTWLIFTSFSVFIPYS